MKTNWITRGTLMVAMLVVAAFWVISCSSNPMSSPAAGSVPDAANNIGSPKNNETPNEMDYEFIRLTGELEYSESGGCWLFHSNIGSFEIIYSGRLRSEQSGNDAIIEGYLLNNIQPRCSTFEVISVRRIEFPALT